MEELRITARLDAVELDGLFAADLIEADAADLIDYLLGYLRRIESGEGNAAVLAREALDFRNWALSKPYASADRSEYR